jgi:lipoprotein-releasing system permease protein
LNLELFIAKKIHFGKKKDEKLVSSPAIKIAVAGVAIGLAAMILSVAIVIGFKKEVRNKVVGFGSHIQITNFDSNSSYDMHPISVSDSLIEKLKTTDKISHVERFTTKPGIIKTDTDFQGVVFKGVGEDYKWDFFKSNMVEGTILNFGDTTITNPAIISEKISQRLRLKNGESFLSYFIEESGNVRARRFNIVGIYNTNLDDYDNIFIITDITLIQRLNGWNNTQVSGLELLVSDYDKLDEIRDNVFFEMMSSRDMDDNTLYTRSIKEIKPMIFSWLELLDMNVWVIIILMLLISGFTIISGLLIIILERTNMIGILKTMGAKSYSIRKTFMYVSSFIVLKGMLWGNIIAIAIILIQKYTGLIQLDPKTYYVSEVPVDVNVLFIIGLNVVTLLISILMMVGPSYLIARISPAKTIRYE